MSGPFATYFGNQRVVAIPVTPTLHTLTTASAAVTTTLGTIVLGPNNNTALNVHAYYYYALLNPRQTAAASSIVGIFGIQFQNAAHAAVGAFIGFVSGTAASGAANGVLSPFSFQPSFPAHMSLAVPATAVEIAFQVVTFGILGAPFVDIMAGYGLDALNAGGTPGDIGGGGMAAQSATNPNAF